MSWAYQPIPAAALGGDAPTPDPSVGNYWSLLTAGGEMLRNVAGQKWRVLAYDADGNELTGDAANISAIITKDDGTPAATNDAAPTEVNPTNQPGVYDFDLTQAETDCDKAYLTPKSSTSGVKVVPWPGTYTTRPRYFSLMGIESDGDVTKVNTAEALTGIAQANVKQVQDVTAESSVAGRLDVNADYIGGEIASIGLDAVVMAAGTVANADNTAIDLGALTYGDDEFNEHLLVVYDSSADEYHGRWISDYTGATSVATLSAALPFTTESGVDTWKVMAMRRDATLANAVHTIQRLIIASATSNQPGLSITGNGTAPGIYVEGGASGDGIHINGGSTSGHAMHLQTTLGTGFQITVSDGHGIYVLANGEDRHGILVVGGSSGTSDGIKVTAGTGGVDIRANITGNLTGTVTVLAALWGIPEADDFSADIQNIQLDVDDIQAKIGTPVVTVSDDIGALNNLDSTAVQTAAAAALTAYDPPTDAEMIARTLVAASYATAANQTTIIAKTNNLPASPAATGDIPTVSEIWTTALTEAYRATGATGTAAQLLYELLAHLANSSISGTTKTLKQLDKATTAKTYTLNDATTPTAIEEAS